MKSSKNYVRICVSVGRFNYDGFKKLYLTLYVKCLGPLDYL